MLTLPAHIRLVLPRLLLKAGTGTGSKIAHQSGFALYGNPPRWHKITADKPAPKGVPVAHDPHSHAVEPKQHFTDAQWEALKLPDSNVNAKTFNGALEKIKEWSDSGNVAALLGVGIGTNTYAKKLATIINHLLALHGSQHKVEPGQKAGTHGAVQPKEEATGKVDGQHAQAVLDSKKRVKPAPAALQVPAFASYDEAAAWAKKRASALGMSWKQYTTTPEYHQQVYPALQAAYQGHKAEADAKSAETGKQLQAQMAELGIKPGDTVTWTQVGSFLNSETHSGVVKLDGNGVPHVHLGYEVAVSKPGGKIGYTKKLRWQPFMKPAAAPTKADGQAMPVPSSADSGPKEGDTKPAADGGTLVLKNGRWVKQGGDAPSGAKPEHFEINTGDVFKLDSQYQKMNAGEWVVYNVSADGQQVYMHKVGAKVPNQTNSATIPAATLAEAVAKGTAKKKGAPSPAGTAAPAPATGKLSAQQLQNLQSIPWFKQKLPDSNTNAKSHNAAVAKIEAMAFAGDTAGLQAFIDAKAGAKQTYVKKQVLLAQTALAGLQVPGATAAVPVEPAPTAPTDPAATPSLKGKTKKIADIDPAEISEWLAAKPGQANASAKFWGSVTAVDAKKFHKWIGIKQKNPIAHYKNLYTAAAIASLMGKHDQFLGGDGAFHDVSGAGQIAAASAVTDPAKIKAAVLAELTGVPAAAPAAAEPPPATAPAAKPPVTADTPLHRKQLAAQAAPAPALSAGQPSLAAATKIKVDAPLYENTEPGHNKFWSVSTNGKTLKTHYGKIGTLGKETVKEYPTEQAAKNAAVKLMDQKKAKGYVYKGSVKHEYDAPGGSVEQGPKDGDTKMGADGLLVFKNGRWHKVGKAMSPSALNSALAGYVVPTNTITAKAKKAALAGDVAMLQQAYQDLLAKGKPLPNTKKALEVIATAMQAPLVGAPEQQGNPTPASEPAAVSAAVPSAPETVPAPAVDSWQQIGPQKGSNPGGKFRDPSGQDWYVKWPGDAEAAKSEVLAAKLYALAGLSSQDAMLVTKGGKLAIASKWVDIKKASSPAELAKAPGALEGFAVDAWLGNWDVVGLSLDNLQIGTDGKAHRVDAGGSLEYRAQGEKKPFGAKVEEIDTLRDAKKNPKAASVFGKMTDADIAASVVKVLSISDAQIKALVMSHGPGSEEAKAKLAETLIARKKDLAAKYPQAAKKAKLATFKIENISKPPSFTNWNGSGKGLSSVPAINEANEAAVQAAYDAAIRGDLDKIKSAVAPVFDKSTHQVVGHKPLHDHPSSHVKAYWADLVNEVDLQLNPPQMPEIGTVVFDEDMAAISSALKPVPSGKTVSAVDKSQKIGSYILLGKYAGPTSSVAPKKDNSVISGSAWVEKAKAAYNAASNAAKSTFSTYVTTSGARALNTALRDGNLSTTVSGKTVSQHVNDFQGLLVDIPPGSTFVRRMGMHGYGSKPNEKSIKALQQFLMSAEAGTVVQEPGFSSTSWSDGNTILSNNDIEWRFTAAKGVKMFPGWLTANKGEGEGLLPPNQRYMIMGAKKVGKTVQVEAVLLPTI